jgi:hypothetical protein
MNREIRRTTRSRRERGRELTYDLGRECGARRECGAGNVHDSSGGRKRAVEEALREIERRNLFREKLEYSEKK